MQMAGTDLLLAGMMFTWLLSRLAISPSQHLGIICTTTLHQLQATSKLLALFLALLAAVGGYFGVVAGLLCLGTQALKV